MKLEKLCRYITRPAISEQRLSISPQGRVRYALKTPWRNGTTHVEFEPVDFIANLAALVPPPARAAARLAIVFPCNLLGIILGAVSANRADLYLDNVALFERTDP